MTDLTKTDLTKTDLTKTENGACATLEQPQDGHTFTPRFDIAETEDKVVLYGDLPGVLADDLELQFEDRELSIVAKVAPRQKGVQHHYAEYGVGDFYRTFSIGEAIDTEKISAELKNGVLTVHLPKVEAVKPKRIEVKTG